jgi:hypothetical protein
MESRDERVISVLEWIATAIAALWIAMSFTYPFGWDQGIFSWAGDVIVRGGMPYVDAWDIKGPLVHYAYALAQSLFGVHLWSIRVLDAALLVTATIAVRRSVAAVADRAAARWAGTLYFLWYASHSYWHTAQPDGWAGMLLVLALSPLLARTTPVGSVPLGIAGLCVGLMTLFKPLFGVFLLLPLAHLAMVQGLTRVGPYVTVVAGWMFPIALMAAWFARHGALDELIAVHLKYSALYSGLGPGDPLRSTVEYVASGVMVVALPVVVYGSVVLWRRKREAAIVLVSWVALGILVVLAQNRFYAYHWLPIVPAVAILAAIGLHDLRSRMPVLAYIAYGLVLLRSVAPIVVEELRFVRWATGNMDHDAYYDAYGESGDDMKAVWWLRETARPGHVFIFGWHSGVGWLGGRQTVSRFGYSLPLMLAEGPTRSQYRAELLEALRATPPQYIVVTAQSAHILDQPMTIADFPELADLVSRVYREVAQFGEITIHEMAQ